MCKGFPENKAGEKARETLVFAMFCEGKTASDFFYKKILAIQPVVVRFAAVPTNWVSCAYGAAWVRGMLERNFEVGGGRLGVWNRPAVLT